MMILNFDSKISSMEADEKEHAFNPMRDILLADFIWSSINARRGDTTITIALSTLLTDLKTDGKSS